ncbi:MAG TPA: D-aminoacyl-tRNA deacylase [Chitinispirillaceae bacterium]|nr:D-aminoacyl-tRNA deacylase [Chitinispirillaceae bacterium]
MKLVIQRVKKATVTVDNSITGSIDKGLLILIGVHQDDTAETADYLVGKCSELRIFPDQNDKMNLSLKDIDGEALVVSQFTLFADCTKGRRPNFTSAADPEKGNQLYNYFVKKLSNEIRKVETGIFGANMQVELINDGPVTLILEK